MSVFNHILLSPEYARDNRSTWIETEFNACQTHRSMYTPFFNRLRAIARYWSEIATFSYLLAFNAPVRNGPWVNRGKCHTVGKRIHACKTLRRIYPSIFNRFPVIQAWSLKIRHFSTFFYTFWRPCVHPWDINTNRSHYWLAGTVPACDGRTDRRTDVQPISITFFSIADARKNHRSSSQGHKMQKHIKGDRVAGVSLHLYQLPTV